MSFCDSEKGINDSCEYLCSLGRGALAHTAWCTVRGDPFGEEILSFSFAVLQIAYDDHLTLPRILCVYDPRKPLSNTYEPNSTFFGTGCSLMNSDISSVRTDFRNIMYLRVI